MTLTSEFAQIHTAAGAVSQGGQGSPWAVMSHVVASFTNDPLLQRSIMNMITLRHRFDHIQYVSCVLGVDELVLVQHPIVAEALVYVSKMCNALPFYPRFYKQLWDQVYPVLRHWETRLRVNADTVFALEILHMRN